MRYLTNLWRNVVRRDRVDRTTDEELRATFDLLVDEKRQAGQSPEDAHRAAAAELGPLAAIREGIRDVTAGAFLDELAQDVRWAVKRLWASPGFTGLAILLVAGGVAASTTIFSALDAFIWRPVPFPEPDRLVHVFQDSDEGEPQSSSFPAYREMAARTDVFTQAAAFTSMTVSVRTEDGGTRPAMVEFATPSYLSVLGLRPSRGRWFAEDEAAPGRETVAVLSHHAWQTRFGGDAAILGRTVRLGGTPVTIVGVGPEDYQGAYSGLAVEYWLPVSALGPVLSPFFGGTVDRPQDHWFSVHARLQEGVSVAQARAAMDNLSGHLAELYAGVDQRRGISVLPARSVRIHPSVDGALVPAAFAALFLVVLVLALVCTNLAVLQLVRSQALERDASVRLALGAGRARIVRQFLTESLTLSTAGGVAGGVLAWWVISATSAMDLPRVIGRVDLTLDARVLGFAVAISVLTGLTFGLAPAARAGRVGLPSVLRGTTTTPARRKVQARNLLTATQVALSLVLLASTGLFLRSLQETWRVDVGFDRDRLVVIGADLSQAGWPEDQVSTRLDELEARLAALPGVEAVVRASPPPLVSGGTNTLAIDGYVSPAGTNVAEVAWTAVSDGYFDTLGIPILHGRAFGPQDTLASQPVGIISEAMAQRYWGTSNVVGRRYRYDGRDESVEIVGVTADVKVRTLTEDPRPLHYRPATQFSIPASTFIARTGGDPADAVGVLRRTVREYDPALLVPIASTMDAHLAQQLALPRLGAIVLVGFSGAALALMALGLYAVIAFSVGQRTREIGVRVALGAHRRSLVWWVVRRALLTIGAGLGIGSVLAFAVARGLGSLLFGVSPADPTTLLLVVTVLVAVGIAAAWMPARRAAAVDPVVALRVD